MKRKSPQCQEEELYRNIASFQLLICTGGSGRSNGIIFLVRFLPFLYKSSSHWIVGRGKGNWNMQRSYPLENLQMYR